MNPELTEEEMRRAFFGTPEPATQVAVAPIPIPIPEPVPEVVFVKPAAPTAKKKSPRHLRQDFASRSAWAMSLKAKRLS